MNKSLLTLLFTLLSLTIAQFTNPGCASFDSNLNCLSCFNGYYMITGAICLPVSPLCLTYNSFTGACLTCYSGFMINNNNCVLIPAVPGCQQYNVAGVCTGCKGGYFLNNNSTCSSTISNCATYNLTNGICVACAPFYSFANGVCNLTPLLGCATQNLGVCLQCQSNYILYNSVCSLSEPNCASYNGLSCQTCNTAYTLSNTKCVLTIPNCASYDFNGNCINCLSGFSLTIQSSCQINQVIIDPFCSQFNGIACIKCSWGYYFNQAGKCSIVSPLCKTFDSVSGNCLTCYNGYALSGFQCVINNINYDPNCNLFNGATCIKCSQGSAFNANGVCIQLDQYCQTFSGTVCSSCYSGYTVDPTTSKCALSTIYNCNKWQSGKCIQCSFGYYMSNSSVCLQVDPLCAIFNLTTTTCTGCYPGYSLYQGVCSLPSSIPVAASQYMQNCLSLNSSNVCTKCYAHYYLDVNNVCQQVSPLCNAFDQNTGKCLSCYNGYYLLADGTCQLAN